MSREDEGDTRGADRMLGTVQIHGKVPAWTCPILSGVSQRSSPRPATKEADADIDLAPESILILSDGEKNLVARVLSHDRHSQRVTVGWAPAAVAS